MQVDTLRDPGELLEQAQPFLMADEARHNLALGILGFARDHPDVYPELEGWIVRDDGQVALKLVADRARRVIATTRDFARDVLRSEAFRSGAYTTSYTL